MTARYSMLIQWSVEDKVYIVTLPEWGGCKTHGRTYELAAKAGREVLELLISTSAADGDELPRPHLFDDSPSQKVSNGSSRFLDI
jgi:antitoxin HicB